MGEHTFRPELCLVQVATVERLYVIDPYAVGPGDIASHRDEIMQTDGHWIPATIGVEQASVAEVLRARPD